MPNTERRRKRIRQIVALTLNPDVVAALETMAAGEMRSKSNFIEVAIRKLAVERGLITPTEAQP